MPCPTSFLGRPITPLTRRRLDNFRANRRGFWSLWMFLALFGSSLFAEFIANDRPLARPLRRRLYFPVFADYPETTFGGDLADRGRLPRSRGAKADRGQGLDGVAADPVQLRHDQLQSAEPGAVAAVAVDWLGTDDQGRDVLARLIYGFRISVLFGLALTLSPR